MRIIIIIIITNEKKKNLCRKKKWNLATAQIVLQYNYCIAGSWAGWGAQAWALGAQGKRARRASERWALGERVQGAGACHAQARCRRTDARGARQGRAAGASCRGARQGRAAGARGRGARGARHELQASERVSGDTAEGLLRHGASALSARGHARPGRGLVRWLGQLGAYAASLGFDLGF